MRMHKLHPRHLPLASLVDKDGRETDIVVDEAAVVVEEADGFLEELGGVDEGGERE